MYLKCIDIQGFKSFPDKIQITFGDGITSIVGPNGSGKSNVCDAIRWVLGEQSTKTLRGAKMEDVIFNGTQARKAVGFAEVSLTIDNQQNILQSDYNEITVTRRYYRSGESEYFINQTPFRLKDIHELFMDTGLGRDGYSIIGQGRIAEILSLKSEDRRQIFEEASGITKYRVRKAESERKLTLTQTNLDRVSDIIGELADRVEPLRIQSEKATRYLELFERQKLLECNIWLREIETQKDTIQKCNDDFVIAQTTLEQNQSGMETADADIEALYAAMRESDARCEQVREEAREVGTKKNEAASRIAILKNNRENNWQKIETIKEQMAQGQSKEEDIKGKIESCEKEAAALLEEEAALLATLENMAKNSEGLFAKEQGMESDLGRKSAVLSAQISEISDIRIKKASVEAKQIAEQQLGETLREQEEALKAELLVREEGLSAFVAQGEEKAEAIANLANVLTGYEKKREIVEKRYIALKEALEKLQKEGQQKEARLLLLEDLEKDFDGFARSVKEVMTQKDRGRLRGVEGPVSSKITVEDAHAAAIEVALGGNLQNIIVETEENAKAAIAYLKDNNVGRATFLPISAIRGNALNEKEIREKTGFVGIASDLVSADGKYKEIVANLLGRIVIANDLDSAVKMARANGYRFRFVTLDGQVVNAGGAMTGGSLNKNIGVLSRKNEMGRLQGELETLKGKQVAEMSRLEQEKAGYDALISQIQDLYTERGGLEREAGLINERVQMQGEAVLEAQKRMEMAAQETERLIKEKKQNEEQIKTLEAALSQAQAAEQAMAQEIEVIRGNQQEVLATREAASQKIMGLKLAMNSKQKDQESLKKQAQEWRVQLAEIGQTGQRFDDDIARIHEENAQIDLEIIGQESLVEEFGQIILAKEKLAEEGIAAKLHMEGDIAKRQKEAQQRRGLLFDLQKEYARLESRLTQAKLLQESVLNKMWETYELSFTAASKMRFEEGFFASKAAKETASIKSEIRSIGSVNVDAIAEYAEVSERFAFLTGQKEDLEKAKDGILRIINTMTQKMRDIFAEQFAVINREFSKTFTELFGGGKATLELTDMDNILECGIDIKVQPPGKNVRSLSLLSGGEQAFVAIALIFAILRVRPTPFCVFDEIEATLDDVNVSRFAAYLDKYKEQIQFIIITHRRGTMEAADVLYGVTMQEQGVSKLLSINVGDVEERLKIKA